MLQNHLQDLPLKFLGCFHDLKYLSRIFLDLFEVWKYILEKSFLFSSWDGFNPIPIRFTWNTKIIRWKLELNHCYDLGIHPVTHQDKKYTQSFSWCTEADTLVFAVCLFPSFVKFTFFFVKASRPSITLDHFPSPSWGYFIVSPWDKKALKPVFFTSFFSSKYLVEVKSSCTSPFSLSPILSKEFPVLYAFFPDQIMLQT